jgi:hypothetical protein
MTTKQIALQVMAHRGLKAMDGALVLTMTRRVGASLRTYRDNGSVRSIKDGRYGANTICGRSRASWTIRGGGSALGHSEHMSQAKRAVISGDVGNNSDICEIPSPTLLKQEITVDVIERFRCR